MTNLEIASESKVRRSFVFTEKDVRLAYNAKRVLDDAIANKDEDQSRDDAVKDSLWIAVLGLSDKEQGQSYSELLSNFELGNALCISAEVIISRSFPEFTGAQTTLYNNVVADCPDSQVIKVSAGHVATHPYARWAALKLRKMNNE